MRKTFQLDGIDCAVCAAKIEKAVRRVDGVCEANLNFVTQKLTLEADDAAFEDVQRRVREAVPRQNRGTGLQ